VKKYLHPDIIISIVMLCIVAFLYANSLTITQKAAQYFPQVTLAGTAVCAVVLLVKSILRINRDDKENGAEERTDEAKRANRIGNMRILFFAVLIVAYIVGINLVGILIATAIFVPSALYMLKIRNIWSIIGLTVGTDLAIYIVFHVLLSLVLPKGSLF